MKKLHQLRDATGWVAAAGHTSCSECLRKLKPNLVMRAVVPAAFFVRQIGEHRLAKFAVVKPHRQFGEIGGERPHMVIVIRGVLADVLACQLAFAPCLVEGVGQKMVFRNSCVKLLKKFLSGHSYSL